MASPRFENAIEEILPAADCPTIRLVPANSKQIEECWHINAEAWSGALSVPQYIKREQLLISQELTKNGGITHWVLIDTASKSDDPTILAACETLRKKAIVAQKQGSKVEDTISHGIGSVFCRKFIYMVKEIEMKIAEWHR